MSGLIGVENTAGSGMCLAVTLVASSAENTDTRGTDVISEDIFLNKKFAF